MAKQASSSQRDPAQPSSLETSGSSALASTTTTARALTPDPNMTHPLATTPNKRPPAEPHTRFNINEKITILMAIILADEMRRGELDQTQPRAGFSEQFCNKVRTILREHPNLADRVRCAPVKDTGQSPHDQTIRDIWATFNTTGFPQAKHRAGQTKDQSKWKAIRTLIASGDHSLRSVASIIGCSASLVHRVLHHSFNVLWYKPPKGQSLTEDAIARRNTFSTQLLQQIYEKKFDHRNCAFSDEAYASLNTKKKNVDFWRFKGESHDWRDNLINGKQQSATVHLFVVLHHKVGIIGPYFVEDIPQLGPFRKDGVTPVKFEGNLNAQRYIYLLQTEVIPELRRRLGEDEFAKCWWQQEGAPAHTAEMTMNYLKSVFGDRILSNAKSKKATDPPKPWTDWPPYSCDLNPLDFFFWAHIRKLLFVKGANTKGEVVGGLKELVPMVELKFVHKAIDEFALRLEALYECRGAHFEYILKKFKLIRYATAERQCPSCNKRHPCPCDDCKQRCIARILQADRQEIIDSMTDPLQRSMFEVDIPYVTDDDDNLQLMDVD